MRPSHAPSSSRSLSNWILLFLLLLTATGSAQTPWIQSHRLGNEVRFLYSNLIRRYDLTTRSWLPDISLPRNGATAFTGDASGNVVAYGTSIFRYSPSWSGELAAGTLVSSADRVVVDGNLIIATHSVGPSGRVTTLNRSTATIIEYKRVEGEPIYGASLAPRINRLFGRTSGVATPDLATAGYSDAGTISGPTNSPYSGTYPTATRAFVFPDDRRVVDSSGSVYSTGSMTYTGSLGPLVTDIAWNGDTPVVLAGNALVAFNPTLEESGRITLATSGVSLAVTSSDAFVFRPAPTTPSVEIITLDSFGAPQPSDSPLDLAGTRFPVTDAFVDTRNVIHLVSGPNSTIVRFSPDSRTFLPSLMLPQEPAAVSYSQQLDRLYFVNHSEPNAIRSIDFLNPNPVDVPFASLPGPAQGIAAANDLLHSSTTTGNLLVHSSFGAVLNNTSVSHTGSSRRWDPVRRRMYRFRENTTPRDLLYEVIGTDGRVGQIVESPYNGEYSFVPPILISPDGNNIIIGSGVVFNATGLTRVTTLPISPTDGIWSSTAFLSIRPDGSNTALQSWNATFTGGLTRAQLPGTPLRILPLPSGFAIVTSVNGSPVIHLLNPDFSTAYQSPIKPLAPGTPVVRTRSSTSISLTWADQSDNEDLFRIEFRIASSNSPWSPGLDLPAGSTSGTQPDLLPDQTYQFRIRAISQPLSSPPSPTVTTRTLSSPDEPLGEPYQLSTTRIYATSLTLSWSDNATNESGFRILRSLAPDGPVTSFSVPADVTTFTDSALPQGTTVYYRIQSFNATTNGELSAQLAVATRSTDSPPPSPGTPVLSEVTPSSVRLTWTDTSLNEDSFEIEQSSDPVTSWSTVATTPFNSSSTVITGLTPFTPYSFRVRATNPSGSTSSAIVTTTTPRVGGEFLNLSRRHGSTIHFVLSGPHRIERYDLAASSWLPPVPLNAQATALWIDSSGLYAAEGTDIIRWNLDGSTRSLFVRMPAAVRTMYATNTHLIASTGATSWTPIPKATGVPRSPFFLSYAPTNSSTEVTFDPLLQRAFFSTRLNNGSSAIYLHDLFPTSASLSRVNVSSAPLPLPAASRTFLFPNGGRIVDDGGSIYATDNLLHLGSLGAPFTDLAFLGSDIPFVLRNNQLHAYNNALNQTASVTLASTDSVRLAVHGTNALVFSRNSLATSGLSIESVPLTSLGSPVPDQPVDANGLAYSPDEILSANDDVVCLFSRRHLSIFRWSRSLRSYLPPIPLPGLPERIALSTDNQRLYTAYASGFIRQINLSAASPAEEPFSKLQPANPSILIATADSLYISTNLPINWRNTVFDLTGNILTSFDTTSDERDHAWDPVLRRAYYRINSYIPTLTWRNISPTGTLLSGPVKEFSRELSFSGPIRIRPDGQRIAFASGQIVSHSTLALTNTLPDGMTDLLWIGDDIASIRPSGNTTLLQRWLAPLLNLSPVSQRISGTPIRILKAGTGFLVITQLNDRPRFTLTDSAFIPSFYSDPTPQAPSSLTSLSRTTTSITLSWSHLADNASSSFVESRIAGSNDPWLQHPPVPASTTQFTISDLTQGTRYEFRASSLAGTIPSSPSASFSISTLSSQNQPIGEPYNFTVRRHPGISNTFSWQDNATNESAFLLLRYGYLDGPPNIIPLPPNTTSYTEPFQESYFIYRIQVVNGPVPGDLSAVLSAPANPQFGPSPPTNFAAVVSPQSIALSWRDNADNEAAFILESFSSLSGTWSPLQTLSPNVTSTVIENPSPGVALTLRVSAINSHSQHSSNSIVVTPQGIGGSFLNLSTESSGIQYFAFASPDRIERYHLSSRQWLSPLPMSRPANALWVDDSAIFAAEDRSLIRWNLDGSGRQSLLTTPNWISSVFTSANILGIHDGLLRTFDRQTALPLKSLPTPSGFFGPSVSPTTGRVFYRYAPGFLNATAFLDLAPDGAIASSGIRGPSEPFPSLQEAPLTRTFPDGSRILDETGRALTSTTLYQLPSIGASDDVAFVAPNTLIKLSNNQIISYRFGSVWKASRFVGPQPAKRISVNGPDVIVFYPSTTAPNGMVASASLLSDLNAPPQGQYDDPSTLDYTPSDAFIDRNGDVQILSRDHLGLFRWSPSERKYTGARYLRSAPASIAYNPATDRLYLSDQSRDILQLDLSDPTAFPVPFTAANPPVRNISLTGSLLTAAHGPAASPSHSVFSLNGNPTSSTEGIDSAAASTWDPANRQLYSLRSQSPAALLSDSITTDGLITNRRVSSSPDLLNPSGPIRPSNDGDLIVLGSGALFRANDLALVRDIGVRPADMLWLGNQLVSLERNDSDSTIVQRWSSTWIREKAAPLPGVPIRILKAPDGNLIVITKTGPYPTFPPRLSILSPDLNLLHSSEPINLYISSSPQSRRIPLLGETVLEVLASGPPPLTYQWFRNNQAIPGATSSQLPIVRAGSSSAGTYRVRVSSGTSTIDSNSFTLNVGPPTTSPPTFSPLSLLVSGGGSLRIFAPPLSSTTPQRSYTVPLPPNTSSSSGARTSGAAVDRLGRLHTLNHAFGADSSQVFLSTHDPSIGSWSHRSLPGIRTSSSWREGDLCLSGDWAVMNRGRFHLFSSEWRPFPPEWLPSRIATTPAGNIFGINTTNIVRQFLPASDSWDSPVPLQLATPADAFAVASNGTFFVIAQGTYHSFNPDGSPLRSLTPPTALNPLNLAIGGTDNLQLAAGPAASNGPITITQTSLATESRFTPNTSSSFPGMFVSWVPVMDLALPVFIQSPPPPATEDVPWSWTPEVTHPDPDATIVITALTIPSWMRFSNGTLSGTPTDPISPTSTISLRARDNLNRESLWSPTLAVTDVNDPPLIPAALPNISASDSAADQLISFASLASDPDVGEVLTWRITANSNPALFSSLSFDAQGRLAIRYAPYVSGSATITVSVTDRSGASAQRSFNISVPALPAPTITSQSPPSFNPLTGLWELPVTIRNVAQRAIGGFSLSTSPLPQGTSLYNASNALAPSPAITDARPLNPNQSITLTLEFLHPSQDPLPAPTLSTTTSLPRPTLSTPFAIDRASFLSPESLLLEFPSEPGTLYQIQYSHDGLNWLDSLSRLRAAGTSTQWIDSGSPRTTSPPGSGSRFYRVKRLAGS
jgi:hypothetical protein